MKFKISIIYLFIVVLVNMACATSKLKKLTIENASRFNYTDKVVSVPWSILKKNYPWIESDNFKIIDSKAKNEITYQLEYLGNQAPINVLLQVSLKSNEKIKLLFLQDEHKKFVTKTYGRYVPERYGDFAWENDKIAFRMYGKALEQVPKQNAFGLDVWVKRTNNMIINERYKRGEYHIDHGDGMDYYHVGHSLGAGNSAPYLNDSIWYPKNYSKWEILDNGPLRTTFRLYFDMWNVDGIEMEASKTVSLDAGSQLNKIKVTYNYKDDSLENFPLVIGIVKRKGKGFQLLNKNKGILGYWEPKHGEDGTTGVGVIIPLKVDNMKIRKNQFLAILTISKNKPFTYYTGAVWDKAGFIKNEQQWFDYLDEQRQQLLDDGIEVYF